MKISIIIPTIGRKTLKTVLEALFLNKNFDQINPEIIVVFDGEPVNSQWSIVNSGFKDKVTILETGKKVYAAGARNLGLEHATGEVIIFIGDDTIPEPDWLQRIVAWHQNNPEVNQALLGRVAWTDELAKDSFHIWLEQKALFDYARLDAGAIPNWRHFYTSNVSVKRAFLFSPLDGEREGVSSLSTPPNLPSKGRNEIALFSTEFNGWGFEDSEFGYRLAQKGMELSYDPTLIVKHDDPQTLEGLIARTQQARINAKIFEQLHSELKILPRGGRRFFLQLAMVALWPLSFIPRVKWWRAWKKAWLG